MKQQHRVLGMLALLSVITYLDRVCIAPNLSTVVLDVGRNHAGAVFGFMNTAGQAAALISSVAFGYQVDYFGNYNAPLVPMVLALCVRAWLWLKVDAAEQLFEEHRRLPGTVAALAV